MKLLIVDDEILVRKGLAMSVNWKELDFDCVFEVSNGLEALAIAKKERPHLIITDIKMPKMDGLELIKALRENNINSAIIVLSCLNEVRYVREAMRFDGALDYVPKLSMSNEELIKIVTRATDVIKGKQAADGAANNLGELESLSLFEESELRRIIEEGDKESATELLVSILAKYSFASLKRHIAKEIIHIFSSSYKKHGGNIYDLKISNQDVVTYIEQAKEGDIESKISCMFDIAFENLTKLKNKSYGSDITKAINYMYENFDKSIKLSDVALVLSMSTSYLSKLFKQKTEQNFVDFLNGIRLEKAKELLRANELTVSQIAVVVGFNDESYFSRTFKRSEGISPARYRNKIERQL